MKYFISLLALIFSLSAQSYPKIDIIKDNSNYLLVNEESLPIIDVNILFAFGSKNDSSKKGITNFSFELLHQQVMNNKKFINIFEEVGAQFSSSVSRESTSISIRFISSDENITIIEPSSIRKIIAERTTQTKNEVPHFYLTIESRMDKLINLRKKVNLNSRIKISFNDLIVKACAMAIAKNPETNISWVKGKIHQFKSIDIAIAVALKEGLITPIVKEADKKGLAEISSEVKSLVKKANQNKLLPDEYNGGSITISNLGMFGITEFQAIINPPQSSIIAVGSIIEKPVVNSGIVEIGHTLKSTISADHRSLDGAVAAKLLKDFSDILEDPFQIWLNSFDMEVI